MHSWDNSDWKNPIKELLSERENAAKMSAGHRVWFRKRKGEGIVRGQTHEDAALELDQELIAFGKSGVERG